LILHRLRENFDWLATEKALILKARDQVLRHGKMDPDGKLHNVTDDSEGVAAVDKLEAITEAI
jgi:hypothetical protein